MEFIGIDVHKRDTQVCIITEGGGVVESRIRTERNRLEAELGRRPRARVLLEASTESEWVACCLEGMGHEVVVADPNFAPMYGTRVRRVKTDRRDARALAEACASGTYRAAHRTSAARREMKARLAVREALVRQRAKALVLMGTLARAEGLRVPTGAAKSFASRLGKVKVPEALRRTLEPLLEVVAVLNKNIETVEEELRQEVEKDEAMTRLCSMPSVGPVTAAAFVATVDEAQRFAGPHQVEAYMGLVPSEMSSGEKQRRGHITKTGSPRVRWLLVQVAVGTMRLKKPASRHLWEWAQRLEARRGKKVAAVALARKVCGILYAMMRDETHFKPCTRTEATQPMAA